MCSKPILNKHNTYAPYWALTLIIFIVLGLATINFDNGYFWKAYVLDMVGPAWNYILFRGLFTAQVNNKWTRFFTPKRTVFILVLVSFGIEMAQYFKLYNAIYDPLDFLAYISILIPLFLIDLKLSK